MSNNQEQLTLSENQNRLEKAGWYLTFALIPFAQTYVGMLLLLISRIKSLFAKSDRPNSSSPNPPLVNRTNKLYIIMLIIMFISGFFSPQPINSLLIAFGFTLLFYVFFFGGQQLAFSEPDLLEKSLFLMAIGGATSFFISLIRYYVSEMPRAINIFSGPNSLGTIIIMVSGIVIGFLYQQNKPYRYFILPYTLIAVATLLASKSRGAWLGFTGMLLSLMVFNKKLIAIVLIILLLSGVLVLTNPALNGRFLSIFSLNNGNLTRIYIWQATLGMIKDHPVFGIGAGSFPLLYPDYASPELKTDTIFAFAHNLFLQVAAEFGFVGFVIFLLALCHVLFMAYSLAKTGNSLYQGLFASLIGVLIHQQVDIPIWRMDIGGAFWLFIGIIIGLYQLEYQNKKPSDLFLK